MKQTQETIPANSSIHDVVEELRHVFSGIIFVDEPYGRNGFHEEDPADMGYDIERKSKIHIGKDNPNIIRVNYLLAPLKSVGFDEYRTIFSNIQNVALPFSSNLPKLYDGGKVRLGELVFRQHAGITILPKEIFVPKHEETYEDYVALLGRDPLVMNESCKKDVFISHKATLFASPSSAYSAKFRNKETFYDVVKD